MLNLAIIGALIVATVLGIYLADKSRMLTHFSTKPEAFMPLGSIVRTGETPPVLAATYLKILSANIKPKF